MLDKNLIIECFKQGQKKSDIAKKFNTTRQAIGYILKKEGIIEENFKYSSKINPYIQEQIAELTKLNHTVTEIAGMVNLTTTAVRNNLKKQGVSPFIKPERSDIDKQRPCKICGTLFVPKYDDGLAKNKYKTCSGKCMGILMAQSKIVYSEQDINKVIELKKESKTNEEISELSKVNHATVKRISHKYDIRLTPEQRQKNAYESKLKQNPNCMTEMRETFMNFSQEEFLRRIGLIVKDIENGKGSATAISSRYELNSSSVIGHMRKNGKDHLLGITKSTGELEVSTFVKSVLPGHNVIRNDRKVLGNLELDVYVPSLNIAIEYGGMHWHSERNISSDYHGNKLLKCQEKGIRLITMFCYEWKDRQNQVKNLLKSALGVSNKKVPARKTEVRIIDKKLGESFVENNHIQAPSKNTIVYFGIFSEYNNELLGVMSLGKHPRTNIKGIICLDRMCFLDGTTVQGGASKLFKYVKEWAKSKDYIKITTWSDNRWSEGKVYKNMGFELENSANPDYFYHKQEKHHSKSSLKLTPQEKALGHKEAALRNSQGFWRVYDCGKIRWGYRL